MRAAIVAALALALAGCACGEPCRGIVCGPCPEAVTIRVTLADGGGAAVVVTGAAIPCTTSDEGAICTTGTLAPGTYSIAIQASGYTQSMRSFTIAPAGAGCCACAGSFEDDVTLARAPAIDGGIDGGIDAGSDDASVDAGAIDAREIDAQAGDGGQCDPSAVSFPMGGTLEEGTLCDDVFVCAGDAAGAARVMAASSRFACSATPEGPCSGHTCAYRDPGGPSRLDAGEIAEICAITILEPTPEIECRVYL